MPDRIAPPEYEAGAQTRKVGDHGNFQFLRRRLHCPKAFAGRTVALRTTDTDGVFDICYRHHVLTQVDLRQNVVQPVRDVSERLFGTSPV
jgi:hypothetical protein